MNRQHARLLAAWLTLALVITPIIAVWSATPTTVHAGGSWSAWLYNLDDGRLVHVFPDGAPATQINFPLPPGTSNYPWTVTMSRDGNRLAACLYDDSNNFSVRVYDISTGLYIAAYIPTGPIVDCSLSRYSFSEGAGLLAFGILNHYPGTPDPRPEWELLVMEMNTSAIVYHLTSDDPQVAATGMNLTGGKLPIVSSFQVPTATFPGLISFRPVQWGTEGQCEYPAVVWNLGQHSVYAGEIAGKQSLDYLFANSEATWVEIIEGLPQGFMEGPVCTNNAVMYSNKMGDRYPIYTDATVLNGTAFVDDGRKIAFSSYANGVTQWWVIDRNGTSSPLPNDIQAYRVWGTLDGYVFLNSGAPGGVPEVRYHRFNGGPQPQAFVAWTGLPGENWRIIWVNPISGGLGLPPFPPAPILGQPPLPPTLPVVTVPPIILTPLLTVVPVITPLPPIITPLPPLLTVPPMITPLPPLPSGGTLTVGGRAIVNTTEGDMLRVRTGPGVGFVIAFQLANGTPVTLLEGPAPGAEGYTWWRIRTDDGRSGWAVEGVQEPEGYLQTLLPLP